MEADLPHPKKHSVRLQEIADHFNNMEDEYAHHLLRELASQGMLHTYTFLAGQDPEVLGQVTDVEGVLQAIVDREPEFLDDDVVMHTLERLAEVMREVEKADDMLLFAHGQLGGSRELN